ncbi:hypothetical protein EV356DRAFT_141988 [Viridothelium virens]|uniref:Uncharacterized protein n=1 Tax=Viridothelium virens TaxID=1048519 RepID=A0A6A6HA79_VIRVR|nr:hypothetical protein EV356DRAFT_141988 [Viridothelium virens]
MAIPRWADFGGDLLITPQRERSPCEVPIYSTLGLFYSPVLNIFSLSQVNCVSIRHLHPPLELSFSCSLTKRAGNLHRHRLWQLFSHSKLPPTSSITWSMMPAILALVLAAGTPIMATTAATNTGITSSFAALL